jgi:CarboxypepD_reg-like domain
LGTASQCLGQGIRGRVIDSQNNQPLPFANVFVSNTTIGTTSNEKGAFEISSLPPAFAVIVVSFVGYETQTFNVNTLPNRMLELNVTLNPEKKELAEIQVKAVRDKEWVKQFKVFKKEFLGSTPNAKKSKIINPWVLEFIQTDEMLIASANEPLKIENQGLGYTISFFITRFEVSKVHYVILGSSKFEEMKPENEKQRLTWMQNRLEAYKGAEQHLFKSMIEGNLGKEGFELFVDSKKKKEIIRGTYFNKELGQSVIPFTFSMMPGKSDVYKVMLPGRIEVHYTYDVNHPFYRDIPYRVFWIDPAQMMVEVNSKGVLSDPTAIRTTGYTRILRVADMLPSDYESKGAIIHN